ncbi:hypothetical protein [Vibrio sp. T11.5]|uniref:hypothetical protein n=1 Tax=Vibrio sp. T11.5 TaxID=2998836 RepID=UPI0022CD4B77|nr:hypothetical protein [Vibrio sp. T11.5]MDA0116876.1 hypothetical protein [Vibrio sp. T11.5]
MRFTLAGLVLILISSVIYQWKFASYDFTGTRWLCSESKSGFTSETYRQFKKVTEITSVYFNSKEKVTYFQTGVLVHPDGMEDPYELILTADNETSGNRLKQTFTRIDWNLKPTHAPFYIRDKDSLVGYKSDLRYEVDGKRLYFFNQAGSEDVNIACHQS